MTIHTQAEKIGVVAETVQIQHAYFGNHEKQFLPPPAQVKKRREFYPGNFFSPTHYIPRHELLDSLRQTLLTPSNEAMALTSALHGMGGIGKSVMARALCDDSAVKAHFTAGTLVAVLGEKPSEADLIRNLRDWIQTVGGTITENAPSLDYLSNLLRESLHDQAYLLVLDDVWQVAHARPFLQGGTQCRVLLTTRDREVARQLAPTAAATPIPTMRPAEAVALLESHADPPLPFSLKDKLRVVKRLGYLPLAIRLAGAQLAFYDDVTTWLAEFKAVDLEAMSVAEVHDSLRQTFELSLRQLEKPMRQRYQTLAIFKEDEAIPFAAIRHLWSDLKPLQLKQTLHLFTQRALLQSQGEGAAQTMSLHDLLRDFMTDELGEAGKIQAHQTLLTSYRATRRAEGWHTAPDDGYLHRHLTYHLNAVANHDSLADQELHGLFANDAWLHARLQGDDGQYDGYIDDLMTAWQRVQIPEPDLIALNVRYALIRTSINSVAESYHPALVGRAVETGLWSFQRAVSLAKKIVDPETKVKMLTSILATSKLSTAERSYAQTLALESILTINHKMSRLENLNSLVPQLQGDFLIQAFRIALDIEDARYLSKTLTPLAPLLNSKQLSQVLQELSQIKYVEYYVNSLIVLIPYLEVNLLAQSIEAVLHVMVKLMTGLLSPLNIVPIQEQRLCIEALIISVPNLEEELLTKILQTSLVIKDEQVCVKLLEALIPHLNDQQLNQFFELNLEFKDIKCYIKILIALIPQIKDVNEQISFIQYLQNIYEELGNIDLDTIDY